jgi:hypothetical protein
MKRFWMVAAIMAGLVLSASPSWARPVRRAVGRRAVPRVVVGRGYRSRGVPRRGVGVGVGVGAY